MKKVKFYLFALILAACLIPARAADIEAGPLSFNIVSTDNQICALVSCATSATGEIVVPASVEKDDVTYSVVSIAQKAFNKCTEITSIYIPDGVTSIGNMAFFQCRKMGSIRLPEGITAIGESTFAQCQSLTEITLPSTVTTIGEFAFTGANNLQTVVLNEGLKSLQESAFSSCESLENIAIPSTLTAIGNSVFYGCESLVAIELPNTVESVGEELFSDCSSLTQVTLPESLTILPYGFFAGCENLPTVALPAGITEIEGSVFGGCKALNSLTLPEGLKEIGDQAFYNCSGLSELPLPQSVTKLGSFLFNGCTALKSIVIPAGVTKLGDSVFKNCRSLTEIVLPEGLTGMGSSVFDSCTSLKKLDFPASMTQQFGISALANLTSLDVLQINSPTFVGCRNSNVIRNIPSTCVLRVPAGLIEEYRADEIWGAAFANIEAIEAGDDDSVATFENLTLAPESYWAGDEEGDDWYYGLGYTQRFVSGQYSFVNDCIPDYQSWCGYAYSNQTATTFTSLADQYRSCVGSGNNGSANYCVAYPDGTMWGETLSIDVVGAPRTVPGFYITNAAYTVNSITNGDGFMGEPFNVGDFFKITIHAIDADGEETASRGFCLADYRFENEADRYYIRDWQYVDLSALGEAVGFYFTFEGSRNNSWGITIPTYFCIDDFGATGTETAREEGTYTGSTSIIDGMCHESDGAPVIYNIQGLRVRDMSIPGIYIVNGKKVIKR